MKSRKGEASDLTAAKTRHGTASTYIHADPRLQLPTKSRGRCRIDPLAGIWDDEIVPMLKAAPGLRPIVVFREISHHHPEIRLGTRRTLERRIRNWQGLNDPNPDVTFRQGSSRDQWFLTPHLVFNVLKSAHQGMLRLSAAAMLSTDSAGDPEGDTFCPHDDCVAHSGFHPGPQFAQCC